jgi:hypothetical protein
MSEAHNTPDQHPPGEPVEAFLLAAQALVPGLIETVERPEWLVSPVADPAHPLRFHMARVVRADLLADKVLHAGDQFTLDFGGHRAGYLSFRLEASGRAPDAPVRLRFVFGEVPTDVAEPLHPYKGRLSESWLQEEVVTVDDLPQEVRLPRRYAFRYVKVEVVSTSPGFGIRFLDTRAHAVTSARDLMARPVQGEAWMQRIDEVSIATLRSCLQTTFEDGPRRDRRLWVGDLRLQALVNYDTFGCNDVVKRCLYLFAGLPRLDGLVAGCVYEKPTPLYSSIVVLDYAALFNVTLAEYVQATGDLALARDLWPVACRQIEILCRHVDDQGLFVDPRNTWLFIDWAEELDRTTALQGVIILALRKTLQLAQALDKVREAEVYSACITRMVQAARRHLFDADQGVFVSGPARQVSWASQAWMTVAGVHETAAQGAAALLKAMGDANAVRPVTPYLYHYMVEGMMACGLRDEALALVKSYWGGMVEAGADTFWEVYDPAQPLSSPYGDIHINSYCHAWSCTPAWIFRRLEAVGSEPGAGA